MKIKPGIDRRNFIAKTALGTLGAAGILSSCSGPSSKKEEIQLPKLLEQAPDGKVIKAGLIGCGGRGTGAAINFLDAGPNLQITALGDVFQDKIDNCRAKLKQERGVEIADENCFIGFDSYEKVIDSGVDIVLLCTPPHFRPAHVEAAVNARKHIFMEKPVAVDPSGARSVMASIKKAQAIGLNMVSGTIRRVQKGLPTGKLVRSPELIFSVTVVRFGSGSVSRNGLTWSICCVTGLTSAGFRATISLNSSFTKSML